MSVNIWRTTHLSTGIAEAALMHLSRLDPGGATDLLGARRVTTRCLLHLREQITAAVLSHSSASAWPIGTSRSSPSDLYAAHQGKWARSLHPEAPRRPHGEQKGAPAATCSGVHISGHSTKGAAPRTTTTPATAASPPRSREKNKSGEDPLLVCGATEWSARSLVAGEGPRGRQSTRKGTRCPRMSLTIARFRNWRP